MSTRPSHPLTTRAHEAPAGNETDHPPAPAAVADAFLRPRRVLERRTLTIPGIRFDAVSTSQGPIATYRKGTGDPVLLVHGWERDACDVETIACALLRQGIAVLAVELPAHGRSGGTQTTVAASARAAVEVQRHFGPTRAAVGHSIGGAVIVHAMALGLETRAAALIAAPSRYRDIARRFGAAMGLVDAQINDLFVELESRGVELDGVSVAESAKHLRQPALFVHSEDDKVVPFSDAVVNATSWPRSTLLRQRGLGHRRLLDDRAVVDAIVGFIETRAPR